MNITGLPLRPLSNIAFILADVPSGTTDLAKKHLEIVQRLEVSYLKARRVGPNFKLPIYDRLTRNCFTKKQYQLSRATYFFVNDTDFAISNVAIAANIFSTTDFCNSLY